MLFRKTILSLIALFMSVSGMPVYAEQASKPEISETDKKLVPETGTASVLGIKNLYAEEPSMLTTGEEFNEAIKTLAAGESKHSYDEDTLIKSIQVVDTRPSDGVTTKDVSVNRDGSYLAWWDADTSTIKLYSESGDVILNPNSYGTFSNCTSLTTLDVSNWDASKVTNMFGMFNNCSSLATLDISNWNTSQVTNMRGMFADCHGLTTLDLSGWDTSQVANMMGTFAECHGLTTLDLSGWNTSQVTNMYGMFYDCGSLTAIYIGEEWNTDKVTNSNSMFYNCTKLPNFNPKVTYNTHANADPKTGYLRYKVDLGAFRYLVNSTFVLSGTSDYGTPVNMVVTSNKNGRMSLKNIEKGTYTLTEVSPTDGYIKNSVKYTVTVTDSGVSVTSDNADYYYETADQKVLFNEPYHAFTIQKASSTDSTIGVAGAEFLLSGVSDYGTEVSQTQTTGSTGIATFDHLEAGNYLLTETKAPEHYALDPISRIVSINKYGTVKIDGLQKEGSSFVWTDIRNADGTVTITKKWNDTLTGTNAEGRALPSIVISTQRTIPDAVTITYNAGEGYFGTDQNNKTNRVTYSEVVDQNGNILSVTVSKGEEKTPSLSGKVFDALYLDAAFTKKAPDSIADYIKENPNVREIPLYAKYKDPPTLTTGEKFNAAIKALAAGALRDTSYTSTDTLIQSVQMVSTRPSDSMETKDVSANKDGSYLAWWDADTSTIKLYSSSGDVILNPNSSDMFYLCSGLTTIDTSAWDTSLVTRMDWMFKSCESLTALDVSNWNTSQVKDMDSMFNNCNSLTTLDVSNWNTGQVTNMYGTFWGCGKLATLDVYNWNTSHVTDTRSMFSGCSSLTTLDVSKWDTSNVTSMYGMFAGCSNITTLDVSKWHTGKVTVMSYMFNDCHSLPTIYFGSNWNTSNVTNMRYMFSGCSSLTTLGVSGWNTSRVTDMSYMFYKCSSLTILDVSNWNTSQVKDMSYMFDGCTSLTKLNVSGWITSQVTNMSDIFYNCGKLTTLDVSKWNTSKVTNMCAMFYGCRSLPTLDVSSWNTSKVWDMGLMFYGCSSLTALNVSGWNTSQVKYMNGTFDGCSSLTAIDISGWNTSQVKYMDSMFNNCSKLTILNVSGWNTSRVTDMSYMFYKCSGLTVLDLSNWNTSQVTDMEYMFFKCSKLTTIYVGPNWNTDNVTSSRSMFWGCSKLPNFNSSVVDKTNAHAGTGGYMTLKS